jgi:hypothetical protein
VDIIIHLFLLPFLSFLSSLFTFLFHLTRYFKRSQRNERSRHREERLVRPRKGHWEVRTNTDVCDVKKCVTYVLCFCYSLFLLRIFINDVCCFHSYVLAQILSSLSRETILDNIHEFLIKSKLKVKAIISACL